MDTIEKICLAIAIGIFAVLSGALGYTLGQNNIRKEALLLGHAHYAYNSEGAPLFKWNECIQMH